MPRIEVVRQVAADPAGVALLLAGPGAGDLWPRTAVHFGAPGRSGLGFVVDIAAGDASRPAHGRIRVVPGTEGPGTTEVRLVLTAGSASLTLLAPAANDFLDGLTEAAQARSSAA